MAVDRVGEPAGARVSAPRSSAATLQALHDQLGTAIDAKDLQGVIKTIDRLRPQLAAVQRPAGRPQRHERRRHR